MNAGLKRILTFLFPEYQIIQAIREEGWIRSSKAEKKGSNEIKYNAAPPRTTTYNDDDHAGQAQTRQSQTASHEHTGAGASSASQGNRASYVSKKEKIPGADRLNELFNGIRAELSERMVGQTQYLDQLCVAFKRPYVTGIDGVKPKNIIMLLGNQGTGKEASVTHMAELLKARRLLQAGTVASLDLALYATAEDERLFLSDLYKALYEPSAIVTFSHMEQCHHRILEIVREIATTGIYKLRSRYVFQNQNLIEATGVLTQQTISEIGANNKFFVLISDSSESGVRDLLGNRFMDAVGDIAYTEAFSDADLRTIAWRLLEQFKGTCSRNLGMVVSWSPEVAATIADAYRLGTGVNAMDEFITTNLFKPLAEYKLRQGIPANSSVEIETTEAGLLAKIGSIEIDLKQFMPKKRVTGIEEVKRELEQVVGIEAVKQYVLGLEELVKSQAIRQQAGYSSASVSMHMIFTGNPGTGKTTIARIVAKYLKALGVLSTGQLREVTRADLVGQYLGQTAQLTNDVIKSALGGVLFIDEAYALCRDKHDSFGLEAIDTLVKGMEDHRDDLVVILAGYEEEMEQFLKVNTGLKSRFPNIIRFEDYTPEEMYRISEVTATSKGYRIAEGCQEPLIRLFEQKQIRGRNDSGNGRLVRNVIEAAIVNQAKRIVEEPNTELDLLTYADFRFVEHSSFDLEGQLAQIVGLEEVKAFVRTQHKLLQAQEKRRKAGLNIDASQSLNMIFSGNPGTGKTTVARLMAAMFRDMGLLKSGQLIETDRGGLVAQYMGQTAKKTEEVFRSALGGVLFIDEAYSLSEDGGSFGQEAINTLVKLIEDYRGEIVVILAGYENEMSEFLKANSGLSSRFPLKIHFPDYSVMELNEIALRMVSAKGFTLADDAKELLRDQIAKLHRRADAHSGNGRLVRNYLEEITRNQSARIATRDVSPEEMTVIVAEDIEQRLPDTTEFNLEDELATIIGLREVKDYIRSMAARLRMQRERKKLGLAVDETQTLHMIFKGNPGTGKTMIARTVAELLFRIGVLKTSKLVETDRSGLVAGYIGQTAIKTRELVMEAMDGVLFIDEAYSLAQGGSQDFGREAIDTLVKMMDDYRDRIVIILAGYSEDMDRFLEMNAGLRSRFPNIMEFQDYSTAELLQIADQLFRKHGYELGEGARDKLGAIVDRARLGRYFGNGRFVRNVYERAVNRQAMRLSSETDLTREKLMAITAEDIEEV